MIRRFLDWLFLRKRAADLAMHKQLTGVEAAMAAWDNEQYDEWDEKFKAETKAYPPFSRLALEERLAIEAHVQDARLAAAKADVDRNKGAEFVVFENCTVDEHQLKARPGDVIVMRPPRRIGPIEAPWNLETPIADQYLSAGLIDLERYRQLMLAKGVDWHGPS